MKDRVAKFLEQIGEIRCFTKPEQIALKTHDFYWYSPILKEQLADCTAAAVVQPSTQDEVRIVAAAAAINRIPITPRGGGTGNYGQCVPLEGGIILDMTKMNRVIEIAEDSVLVEAGARISRLDDTLHEHGKELLMFPSTRRIATIGGFISGGSGGIGSLRHGMLRDDGNVRYVKIMTLEPEPRIIELSGQEVHKVQHAYGTNGIILELRLGFTEATDWVHTAALFDGYDLALRAGMQAQADGLDCYLLSPIERRFAPFYDKWGDKFPSNRDALFAMVAPDDLERFSELTRQMGGTCSFAMTLKELEAQGLPPAYECGWNHTTLMALKADPGWTYLQVEYPVPFDPDLVLRQMERYGGEVLMHHEIAMLGGQSQIFGLPLVRYKDKARLYEVIQEMENVDNCYIYDPHAYTIEDGGMKEIDLNQIDFKKQADPFGLMNPGKTKGWTPEMAQD